MDSKRMRRAAIGLAIAAVVIGLLYLLRNALVPVFAAMVLAYLLDPLIDRLEARKINRSAAILMLAGVVTVAAVFLGGFLLVQAQRELVEVFHNLPGYIERVQGRMGPFMSEHLGVELPESFEGAVTEVKNQVKSLDPSALKPVTTVLGRITSSTVAFVSWMVGLFIIPVFLFYFLRDWDLMKVAAADYVPVPHREYVIDKARKIDEILGAFMRGQLTICLVLGVLYSLGLLAVGIDLAVVIGMFAGLAFIVPYLGTILGVAAASVMALLEHGLSWHLLAAWGVFGGVQIFEGTILTPRVMGEKVGLSPVIVIIALLVGADFLGLLGMLVAVPAAAVAKVFFEDAVERYRNSEFFLGDSKEDGSSGGDE